jgi:hypothetical protein
VAAGRASFRKLRAGGSFIIICEGVPPTLRCAQWYTDMFRHKEERHTLSEGVRRGTPDRLMKATAER